MTVVTYIGSHNNKLLNIALTLLWCCWLSLSLSSGRKDSIASLESKPRQLHRSLQQEATTTMIESIAGYTPTTVVTDHVSHVF